MWIASCLSSSRQPSGGSKSDADNQTEQELADGADAAAADEYSSSALFSTQQ